MKKYQQGGSPMPNFWEAGLESLNFDLYKNAFDQRSAYGNQFTTEMNNLKPPDPPKKSIWAKRNNRRAGEYRAAVEDYENKKSTATEQYKQVNSMMLPLGMLMQGQQGYMDYLSRPKENLQEEQGFFGFKQGGNVNKTGYTPGYASMNNSYNIIPSNNITMKNTPFPVLGIGSNGQKQMMMPGQQYSFGNSSHVTEYPMRYQEGGEINQEPISLQAEKGEWFSTPDGLLAKVKAKESHKKQDKDEVSDILEPGSFIYSDDKKLTIDKTKKVKGIDLEEITFGRGPIEYKETEQTPLPKEIKFIDIMNKNKMTPAQIAAQVYAKYPSTDREKDAFSISANEQNKGSRMPYLAVLQELNKRKQTKQPQKFQYGGTVQHFQEGDQVNSYSQPPDGFLMPAVGQSEYERTTPSNVKVDPDKKNVVLKTAGDPWMYRVKSDGSYETKKKTSTGSWIKMNENQTAALTTQIEAGIFDANYKPKNVKPAATIRTKQDLDKHDTKITPYTKSGYAFTRDFNDPTRTELNDSNTKLNIKYPNIPYVPYQQSTNYNYGVTDSGNTTDQMAPYGDPTNAQVFNQYQAPYAIATGGALGRGISGLVGNAALGAGRVAGSGIGRIAGTAGTEGWTIIPSQGLLGQGAGAAIEGGLGRSLLGQGSQQALNIGSRIPQLAVSAYQQGGLLGSIKNMGNHMNNTTTGNPQGGMFGGISNMMNGMGNQPLAFGDKGVKDGQPLAQPMYQSMGMLNPIYNQPTNNAITGLGYKDPMEQRDKAFRNQGVYGSNLYSQPSTTNKNLFQFEQGGYIPHYQQGGSNKKIYGGGMWGGLVGSVTDIVTGIFNQVRGDKNAKKSQKELDANKLEQLATNANMNNINMVGTIGNYASQDPAYEYLNLQNQYARGDNAYQNIGSNLDNAQLAAQNQAITGSAGFMRNAASMGLSPHQSANYAANMQANAINNNNQLGLNYTNQRNSNIRSQLQYNSGLDNMYSQDQQLGRASVRGNLNKLNSSLISGITSNGVNKLYADQNIRNNYLANTMGLRNQTYRQMVEQNMMMGNNIKNAFNNGQGLYLNQQQQNLQNRNNYQNDPSGNYYGFSGSNPYGQFPYDSGPANYQFNPNDPNYDNVG